MKYVKITNLFPPEGGICDYKGMNIDLFVPGKQVYDGSTAYLATLEDVIPQHSDITELTEEEYLQYRYEVDNRPMPLSESERLALLEKAVEDLILSGGGL